MKWFWRLTGGRPMKVLFFQFTDVVDGRPVYSCVDRLGRSWLANGKWSLFRVRPLSGALWADQLRDSISRDDDEPIIETGPHGERNIQ